MQNQLRNQGQMTNNLLFDILKFTRQNRKTQTGFYREQTKIPTWISKEVSAKMLSTMVPT